MTIVAFFAIGPMSAIMGPHCPRTSDVMSSSISHPLTRLGPLRRAPSLGVFPSRGMKSFTSSFPILSRNQELRLQFFRSVALRRRQDAGGMPALSPGFILSKQYATKFAGSRVCLPGPRRLVVASDRSPRRHIPAPFAWGDDHWKCLHGDYRESSSLKIEQPRTIFLFLALTNLSCSPFSLQSIGPKGFVDEEAL